MKHLNSSVAAFVVLSTSLFANIASAAGSMVDLERRVLRAESEAARAMATSRRTKERVDAMARLPLSSGGAEVNGSLAAAEAKRKVMELSGRVAGVDRTANEALQTALMVRDQLKDMESDKERAGEDPLGVQSSVEGLRAALLAQAQVIQELRNELDEMRAERSGVAGVSKAVPMGAAAKMVGAAVVAVDRTESSRGSCDWLREGDEGMWQRTLDGYGAGLRLVSVDINAGTLLVTTAKGNREAISSADIMKQRGCKV